ncbi:MAG TPA: hypothetical protein VK943_16870 [Arenibaculum sp.]|nr:hypothetical protein [Arenibaculum sp.]
MPGFIIRPSATGEPASDGVHVQRFAVTCGYPIHFTRGLDPAGWLEARA